jgi:hypothetical protein
VVLNITYLQQFQVQNLTTLILFESKHHDDCPPNTSIIRARAICFTLPFYLPYRKVAAIPPAETGGKLNATGDVNPHPRSYVSGQKYLRTDNKMGSELL